MTLRHSRQWQIINTALSNKRFPQALLLIGPAHYELTHFVLKIAELMHCKQPTNNLSCGQCSDCQMIQQVAHPDLHWVKPEKIGSAIKIEQIRELQHLAFLTSQRSVYKIIIIESADRLNTAASNALLKLLEEPSEHTHFILIAEQIATILPTILSRCQKLHFSSEQDILLDNLLQLGNYYPEHSERAQLIKQADVLIQNLIAVIEKKEEPSFLASQWSQYSLNDLLWFLYLVYSQVNYLYINNISIEAPAYNALMKLKELINPLIVFAQIDKINNIFKKLSHNININPVLALEDLLYSLSEFES